MHNIDETTGRAAIAYVGKTPWHGLGERIDPDSTIEEWQTAAGLDWTIEKRPIAYGVRNADGTIKPQTIADRFAHVRSDTQQCLGIGSDRFKLIQPGDVLEFYRDLLQGSRFRLETAGALKGGAKIWALAKSNLDLTLGRDDRIGAYLLLATANDGTMSTVADFTSVRVVCQNTLSMAVGSNGDKAAIRVPHSRTFDADDVKTQLGLLDGRLETFAADADTLTQIKVDDRQAVNYFAELYARRDSAGNVTNERTLERVVNRLMAAYKRSPGAQLDTANGTAWGLVNAVTRHVDYDTRSRGNQAENRFNSGQFGLGAALKIRAFDEALALAA